MPPAGGRVWNLSQTHIQLHCVMKYGLDNSRSWVMPESGAAGIGMSQRLLQSTRGMEEQAAFVHRALA